jgi:hypothetical protein
MPWRAESWGRFRDGKNRMTMRNRAKPVCRWHWRCRRIRRGRSVYTWTAGDVHWPASTHRIVRNSRLQGHVPCQENRIPPHDLTERTIADHNLSACAAIICEEMALVGATTVLSGSTRLRRLSPVPHPVIRAAKRSTWQLGPAVRVMEPAPTTCHRRGLTGGAKLGPLQPVSAPIRQTPKARHGSR